MKRALVFALAALAAAACQHGDKKDGPASSTSSEVPRVSLSAQPWVSGAPMGVAPPLATSAPRAETDGRETTAGNKIGKEAASGCSDKNCLLGKCGKLCTAWMDETYPSFKTTRQRNGVYFGCLGACISTGHEAGVQFQEGQ